MTQWYVYLLTVRSHSANPNTELLSLVISAASFRGYFWRYDHFRANYALTITPQKGFWEPTDQLALDAIGLDNAVIFQNTTVYREIYSLYTTAEKLEDPTMRQSIVEFLKKLLQASNKFVTDPDNVIPRVASQVKIDEDVLREAWSVHDWRGGLPADLVDTLTEEDKWVAKQDSRSALARADIESFIDWTVLEEARGNSTYLY